MKTASERPNDLNCLWIILHHIAAHLVICGIGGILLIPLSTLAADLHVLVALSALSENINVKEQELRWQPAHASSHYNDYSSNEIVYSPVSLQP